MPASTQMDIAVASRPLRKASGLQWIAEQRAWILPFLLCFVYFASITALRRAPWLDFGVDFTIWMGILWAGCALTIGLMMNKPSAITLGFLLACLTPFHRVSVLAALVLASVLLVRVIISHPHGFRDLVRRARERHGFNAVLLVCGYATVVWLIRLGDSTDGWSLFALASSIFMVPAAAYSLTYLSWTHEERAEALRLSFIAIAALGLVVLLYPALTHRWDQYSQAIYVIQKASQSVGIPLFSMSWLDPDFNVGSLRSSHFMSVVMLAPAFGLSAYGVITGKARYAMASLLFWYLFLMGENAHVFAGVVAAGLIAMGLLFGFRRVHPGWTAGGVLATLLILSLGLINWFYGDGGYFRESPKAKAYQLSLSHALDHPGRMILGEGPAAYSSYASRKRLPASLTDDTPFPVVPRYAAPHYAEVMQHAHRAKTSSTINRALSGFLGLFMEWGLIGSALLLWVMWLLMRSALRVWRKGTSSGQRAGAMAALALLVVVFCALPFRPYLEYPDVMAVTSVLFALVLLPINHDGENA